MPEEPIRWDENKY